jgi:hypothetical protein
VSALDPETLAVAVAGLLATTTRAGIVVANPVYEEEEREYFRHLTSNGTVNGWLVAIGSEQSPTFSPAGVTQVINVILTAAVGCLGTIDGETSAVYFGAKVAEAKALFAAPANRDLGLAAAGEQVRSQGLYAPNGYYPLRADEYAIYVGPEMVLPVWVSQC